MMACLDMHCSWGCDGMFGETTLTSVPHRCFYSFLSFMFFVCLFVCLPVCLQSPELPGHISSPDSHGPLYYFQQAVEDGCPFSATELLQAEEKLQVRVTGGVTVHVCVCVCMCTCSCVCVYVCVCVCVCVGSLASSPNIHPSIESTVGARFSKLVEAFSVASCNSSLAGLNPVFSKLAVRRCSEIAKS